MYQERRRFTPKDTATLAVCLFCTILAAVFDSVPLRSVCIVLFGAATVGYFCLMVSRREALRVDDTGITLHRPGRTPTFVPWDEALAVWVWETARCSVGVERRPSCQKRRARMQWVPGVPRGALAESVAVVGWRLDRQLLTDAVSTHAPHIAVHILDGSHGIRSIQQRPPARGRCGTVAAVRRCWNRLAANIVGYWLAGGVVALIGLVIFLPQLPGAWAARENDGRLGTWTVTEVHCPTDTFCRAWGDFSPADGGPGRDHVTLSGRDFAVGEGDIGARYPAIDTGGHVYTPGGGRAWAIVWIVAALSVLAGAWLPSVAVLAARRWL
ncbi:hypothetical protein [Nocardia sp. BMG51109]|uniref:hypothetical protein n=1 Tax=Nocardia sp. BMG51109 TaxID=1056816 RepID=UPI0004B1A63A|nr:hypothetical protein [Nocardia sp. BMG51109]